MMIRELDMQPCTMRKHDPAWRFAPVVIPTAWIEAAQSQQECWQLPPCFG
jgi:hypothetical protein